MTEVNRLLYVRSWWSLPRGRGRQDRATPDRAISPRSLLLAIALILIAAVPSFAQQSPWENSVNRLSVSFTGPIAHGLALVAIVVGGLGFAFGETGSKHVAGIVFGVGMAIGAVNLIAWLFP
jgi:type IV secretory pathway VirB2 component (pilin)